ncbi:hypothetical protein N1H31_06655 [Enterococcus durans]|nr:hypothetical protein [Enterococcus durans]
MAEAIAQAALARKENLGAHPCLEEKLR